MNAASETPLVIAVEARFPLVEVEAIEPFLDLFRNMIRKGVITCPANQKEPLLSGLERIQRALKDRQPPFEG